MKLFTVLFVVLGLILACLIYAVICRVAQVRIDIAQSDVAHMVDGVKAYVQVYGEPPHGDSMQMIQNLNGVNPKGIIFWEIEGERASKELLLLDPWGSRYEINFSNPSFPWAYSTGRNCLDEGGNGDDVASWK